MGKGVCVVGCGWEGSSILCFSVLVFCTHMDIHSSQYPYKNPS